MGHTVLRGERFAFDADVWAEEVYRFREHGPARTAADRALTGRFYNGVYEYRWPANMLGRESS